MIAIQELTQEQDLANGFRGFLLTDENLDARTAITISVRREENLALYDEAASFSVLPFSVETNLALAQKLIKLADVLLKQQRINQLAPVTDIDAATPRAFCHEG